MERQKTTYCLSELKALGWSPKLIEKLLPKPILKKNPMFSKAAPMKLWNISDVEQAMETQEFQDYLEKRAKRQQASRKAVETKKQKALVEFEKVKESIFVQVISEPQLRKETFRAKRDWYSMRNIWDNPETADFETQRRWMVNYIRHNLTSYEDGLYEIYGKVGKQSLYFELKKCILEKIAEEYPYLADECEAQIRCIGYQNFY